jgi:hypothetical protein
VLSPESSRMSPSGVFVLATRGAAADETGGSSAVKGNTVAAVEHAVCTGVRNLRALTRVSLPIPQWAALEGCTAVALMAEHEDKEQASGQRACACGALTRVRRVCLWRAQRACATPLPQGGAKARSRAREQRDVAVWLTSSATSAFVNADQVRSSPLAAHCQGGCTLSRRLSPCDVGSQQCEKYQNITLCDEIPASGPNRTEIRINQILARKHP